jgi:hypothetical protein
MRPITADRPSGDTQSSDRPASGCDGAVSDERSHRIHDSGGLLGVAQCGFIGLQQTFGGDLGLVLAPFRDATKVEPLENGLLFAPQRASDGGLGAEVME